MAISARALRKALGGGVWRTQGRWLVRTVEHPESLVMTNELPQNKAIHSAVQLPITLEGNIDSVLNQRRLSSRRGVLLAPIGWSAADPNSSDDSPLSDQALVLGAPPLSRTFSKELPLPPSIVYASELGGQLVDFIFVGDGDATRVLWGGNTKRPIWPRHQEGLARSLLICAGCLGGAQVQGLHRADIEGEIPQTDEERKEVFGLHLENMVIHANRGGYYSIVVPGTLETSPKGAVYNHAQGTYSFESSQPRPRPPFTPSKPVQATRGPPRTVG